LSLPKTLVIGGVSYSVVEDTEIIQAKGIMGESSCRQCRIGVDGDIAYPRKVQTVIHEVLHILIYESGLEESLQNHIIINPLANLLTRFLVDNDLAWVRENSTR
jgi:hypothetical protein